MRYILTGKYANGDDYAEATESLAELAYIVSEINRWHDHASVGENLRVDAATLVIETEGRVMSLHINFEPHSWYMGFAIKANFNSYGDKVCTHCRRMVEVHGEGWCYDHTLDGTMSGEMCDGSGTTDYTPKWSAYTDNGNTYRVDELHADTLRELRQQIKDWHKARAERDAYNRARIGEL